MKEFFRSVYVKAAAAFIVSGFAILILQRIINHSDSVGNVINGINSVFMPIYIGLVLAFIMCPIYNKTVKGIFKRTSFAFVTDKGALTYARIMSSVIVLVIIIFTSGTFVVSIVPQIVTSIVGLINVMPERLETFQIWAGNHWDYFPQLTDMINNFAEMGLERALTWLEENLLGENAGNLAADISLGVLSTVRGIINIFIGILICIYLLNYKERLFAQIRKATVATFTPHRAEALYEFMHIANKTFVGFLVGRIIDAFVIGVITYVCMSILGLPYTVLISVLIGVTNIIPFFGPFIGAIPSFFIILLVNPTQALYFLIMILLIQQLDGNVIGPNIVGDAIGLSSFWVIISILVGGGFFGFMGMFLGVPIFAIIYIYADKHFKKKLKRKDMEEHTDCYLNYDKYGVDKEALLSGEKRK